MTRTRTSTATKVLVGAAVAGAAAYGFMMLGDTAVNSSDPVYDPSTIQYCRNQCIVTFGDACLEREEARCLEFSDGRCVLRERTESCDAQGHACWTACDFRFGEVPGYYPPGYYPPGYVPPGYMPPTVMEEVPVGYVVPGYTPAGYMPPGSEVPLELMPGYVPPGYVPPLVDLPPGYVWPGGIRLESDEPTSTPAEREIPPATEPEERHEAPELEEKQSFFQQLFN